VIEITAAIEDHFLHTLGDRLLGDLLADFLGRGNVAAGGNLGCSVEAEARVSPLASSITCA